jgi:glucokinase
MGIERKRDMAEYIGCIDFGGTKVRAAVADTDGQLRGEPATVPTEADKPAETVMANIARALEEAARNAGVDLEQLTGVGVGSPGPLDLVTGTILNPPNLPTLQNFPLKASLEKLTRLPVFVNNDANVFVLGEAWFGAGRGARIVYGVTLGTGFGSGFVIDGKIYGGATGTAAEIWCFPYRDTIIEEYVSGRAVKRFYREQSGEDAEPKEIAEKARRGDGPARKAWKEFGRHLGIGLAYVVDVVDPEVIVVGGSISQQYDLFEKTMEKTLRERINPLPRERLRLMPAELGDEAPLLGAASLVLAEKGERQS